MTALLLLAATLAQAEAPPAPPSPSAIAAAAPAEEWVTIADDDLLVMELAPGGDGAGRRIVIQLVPEPFGRPWVDNIRTLARARWWDGTSVNRVQDNYVAQWGDAAEQKPLPPALTTGTEAGYTVALGPVDHGAGPAVNGTVRWNGGRSVSRIVGFGRDPYADITTIHGGLPFAGARDAAGPRAWPIHCYGSVGVGRNLSPDTGSGAELYAVIGHAPRHLDRNIAVVGRVIEGIEHLSSLPRGTGNLGFYERPEQRVAIRSIRLASDLSETQRPRFQYLSERGDTFARYVTARQNRELPFFIRPAGGADICNVPVPVRRAP